MSGAGGDGLPPGYCEEHAMPVPDVTQEGWAAELVKKMTEEEKYRLIHGVGFAGRWPSRDMVYIPYLP